MVGEESTAVVQANNFNGEPCAKQVTFQCELMSELTGVVVRGNVRRRGESQYEINYQPTIKGRHQLLIKIKDQHIRGSPFPVTAKMSVKKLGTPIRNIYGLNHPLGVAINKKGEIVVTENDGHCVTVFSLSGKKLQSFGTYGSGQGQFCNPRGVAVDSMGNLLVADASNYIQTFSANGQFIAAVGAKGKGSLQFNDPSGLPFNTYNNKIYVADVYNDRIQVLNSDLTYSGTFGEMGSGNGQFDFPRGVSCDSSGNMYVAIIFKSSLKFVRMFGQRREELNKPTGIAVDADGVVYVSERDNRVSLFTSKGQFLMSFGDEVVGPGRPIGLAVDTNGVVCVCV